MPNNNYLGGILLGILAPYYVLAMIMKGSMSTWVGMFVIGTCAVAGMIWSFAGHKIIQKIPEVLGISRIFGGSNRT